MRGKKSSSKKSPARAFIAPDAPCFVIAEAGVNHDGSLKIAIQLIDAAKKTGADAVKFQTWKTENIIVPGTQKAEYQRASAPSEDQFSMLKKLELSFHDFATLREHASKIGIVFFSTPDDDESLEFLIHKLHVPVIKIGSAELMNIPFITKAASYRIPMIISTGMASLADVKLTVAAIESAWPRPSLAILHCTTAYPTPPDETNLNVISTYRREFPNHTIGFSDHTAGILAAPLAVALGARVIEKHFTLDTKLPGPDHSSSLGPEDFTQMVRDIRATEQMLGSAIKAETITERSNKTAVKRFLVAARDIEKGETISLSMVTAKRTSEAGGLPPHKILDIVKKRAARSIARNSVIKRRDLRT